MSPLPDSEDARLVRYLLGAPLPDAELERLEQKYFCDDRYFDHVSEVEDDLIDDYLRGTLTAGERAAFDSHFLMSPHRRTKLEARREIVEFFRRSVQPKPLLEALRDFFRSQAPWARLAVAAAGIVIAVALGALGASVIRLSRGEAQLRARIAALEALPARASTVAFLLSPGVLRSSGGEPVRIAPAAETVLLRLALERDAGRYVAYEASLRTVEGEDLWSQRKLTAGGSTVEILLPARMLAPGDYLVAIDGRRSDGNREALPSYAFRVEK